ncbi:MAG: hypothetical protein ACAH22_17370, partial [Tardiphaga sp.]
KHVHFSRRIVTRAAKGLVKGFLDHGYLPINACFVARSNNIENEQPPAVALRQVGRDWLTKG